MTGEIIPLGARLRQRRSELGLTQTEAAQQLAVARTAYRLWEMEAARPAPDRWRVIAKWLGVSMSALLIAGELIDDDEALDTPRATRTTALTGNTWGKPTLFDNEAARLRDVVTRLQEAMTDTTRWQPGRFVRRLPSTRLAPALARIALVATAIGIPSDAFDDAELLTSELVTNAVQHSASTWIEVGIEVDAERLRIEVSDEGRQPIRPRTPSIQGGWGLALVGTLATRWGVEKHSSGKTVWIEMDLTSRP